MTDAIFTRTTESSSPGWRDSCLRRNDGGRCRGIPCGCPARPKGGHGRPQGTPLHQTGGEVPAFAGTTAQGAGVTDAIFTRTTESSSPGRRDSCLRRNDGGRCRGIPCGCPARPKGGHGRPQGTPLHQTGGEVPAFAGTTAQGAGVTDAIFTRTTESSSPERRGSWPAQERRRRVRE